MLVRLQHFIYPPPFPSSQVLLRCTGPHWRGWGWRLLYGIAISLSEGEKLILRRALEIVLSPSTSGGAGTSPSSTADPDPTSGTRRATDPTSGTRRATDPASGTRRATATGLGHERMPASPGSGAS